MADISKIKPNGSSGTGYDIKDATARSALENKANNTQTFTEASTRANIASGETMSTLFGKIKKFFTDLKTVAFTGSYSDLSDQPTITDEKVKQENTTGSADYRVLLSNGANDTTETKTARKSTNLKFNPSTGNLQATQLNGVTIGSSPKFTDNNTTYTLSADTDNNKIKLTPSSGSAQSITVPYATASGMCVGQATSAVNDTDGNPIKTTYSKTDEKVKQENTTTNAEYRILFSNGANDTTETKTARKNTNLKYNPSTKILTADSINAAIKAGGKIRIYNDTGTYYVELISDTTSNRQFILPNSGSTDTLATREYLNSNCLPYTPTSVTLTAASGTLNSYFCYRFGRLVILQFQITGSYSSGSAVKIINGAPKPSATIQFSGYYFGSNTDQAKRFSIDTTGAIYYHWNATATNTSGPCVAQLAYYAAS